MPGASFGAVVESALRCKTLHMASGLDWLIFMVGIKVYGHRNCSSNSSENVIMATMKLLEVINHCSVIICSIPYGYDLYGTSYEKIHIKKTNLKFRDLVSQYPQSKFFDLWTLPRKYHMKHGMHINFRGKKVSLMLS